MRHSRIPATIALAGAAALLLATPAQAATSGRAHPHHSAAHHTRTVPAMRPALVLGSVDSVTGTAVVVTVTRPGDGDGDADDAVTRPVAVQVDAATTVTVDGATGALAAGQFVAVVGTWTTGSVHATTVYAFSTAPATMFGRVASVSGFVVTLAGTAASTVDLGPAATPVPVWLDGGSTTGDMLVPGTWLLVLGQSGTGGFVPAVAFAAGPRSGHHAGRHGRH